MTDRPEAEVTVRLATGRYRSFHPSQGLPVGVTLGKPKFPLGYRIAAEIDELKPYGLAFRKPPLTPAEFDAAYRRRLDQIGVDRLRERFEQIAAEHGEPLCLLCFEDVLAGERCHRRTFAAWWSGRARWSRRSSPTR
jgi:hypothetical protein